MTRPKARSDGRISVRVMAVKTSEDFRIGRENPAEAAKSGWPGNRREALLQAAAEVFFEQGYAATKIDAIIDRVGGSKRNIYNEFGNKEGLFLALVARNADMALSALPIEVTGARDVRETLTAFGQHLMAAYMSPSLIGIYRIAITEANRFPALVSSFYEQGPGRATSQLAGILEDARAREEIRIDDCSRAAGHFVGMIRGNLHLQVVLGLRPPLLDEEIRDAVASAVDVFLDGVLPRQGT
jgi:AcrR family transcriptional regulator